MLKTLTLTNFRRHRDLKLDFSSGLQVLRSANEGGKSTTIEGFAYTLFGTKALRTSLDETVTWNEDVKTLRAVAEVEVEGVTYRFSRGKSGAEVLKDGEVFVTGQTEVSAFATQLFGADGATAAKLMLANQGSLRGALEEGPKALSLLIEDLSDMSVFDQILDAAQEKLALGNPGLLEERLKGAESTLAAASANLPPQPDLAAHAASLAAIDAEMQNNTAGLPAAEQRVKATSDAYDAALAQYGERMRLEQAVASGATRVTELQGQANQLQSEAETVVTDSRDALRKAITEAEDHANRAVAFRFFNGLPTGPRFGGSSDEFQTALTASRKELAEVEKALADLDKRETQVKARRINHDKCDKCGQDVTHLASVIETNKLVDAELADISVARTPLLARKPGLSNRVASLGTTDDFARKHAAALTKVVQYVTLDEMVYPPKATWAGTAPREGVDVESLRGQLKRNEAMLSAATAAKARYEMVVKSLETANTELAQATAKLAAFTGVGAEDVVRLENERNAAVTDHLALQGSNILLQQRREADVAAFTQAQGLWSMARARIEDAEKTIAACKADLDSIGFNNALVKKLRALRPMVADQLWNTVLTSVSVMFTSMRGETSIVTKGKDGFRVNGQAVESLSGSTLDLLGLALRCSLLKTFVPHCDLLVLDEVTAGCDQARTEALVGFIKTAGFGQVLLITHEDISETVSDNILEI